jgi:hypothetical protein
MTVHGLLTVDMCLESSPDFTKWRGVFPSEEDINSSMPINWASELQQLLPLPARNLLQTQQTKFEKDWAAVSQSFGASVSREDYLYSWMLVNSRTFYYVTPKTEKFHRDDRMVLQPVADLFNHSAQGCSVAFDTESFTIKTQRAYSRGEEITICYGSHSNDFLLVEYGFFMDDNKWDEVCLDEAILPQFSTRVKERLEEAGFLGNYVLDRDTVCYRTQVALMALCVPMRQWKRFMEGLEAGDEMQRQVDEILVASLKKYSQDISGRLEEIRGMDGVGLPCHREMLQRRWVQIRGLVDKTIERLES